MQICISFLHLFIIQAMEFTQSRVIIDLHVKHRFSIIAIGNGTACRETQHAVAKVTKSDSQVFMDSDSFYIGLRLQIMTSI